MTHACPAENTILDWVEGRLDEAARKRLLAHVDGCSMCRSVVAGTAAAGTPRALLSSGARVDRYVILEVIGAGAMGLVYAAWDPDLSRKIALKLLRTDALAQAPTDEHRQRMVREARAMAQLSHPNVIAIHDVGSVGDEIFLAMELVEGENLQSWLRTPRPWEAVVRVFTDAGRGLAAAHAAGLVHRDFKPANVLVGRDGRVRVTDFGLARELTPQPSPSPRGGEGRGEGLPSGDLQTRAGALMGTPAYMAPEQRRGEPVDQRSDLYSYSVALWEALSGERPTEALTPTKAKVPRWLQRHVAAGLAVDPAARPASMAKFVEGLQPRSRVTPLLLGFAALATIGIVATAAANQRPHCEDVAWEPNAALVSARKDAFTKSGRPNAEASLLAIEESLRTYRAHWREARREACEATWVHGTQSQSLLDLRMQCLDERASAVNATEEVLSKADVVVIDHATQLVGALPSLGDCANTRALQSPVPPPRDEATERTVASLKSALDQGTALGFAYKHDAALGVLQPAVAEARKLGYRPIEGRLEYQLANVLNNAHRPEEVLGLLHDAAISAEAGHDDATVADAWTLLAKVESRAGHRKEATLWNRYASTAIDRLGGDPLREAARLQGDAMVAADEQRYDDALRIASAARAMAVKASGPDSFRVGQLEEILGGISLDAGRADEGLLHHHASRAIREKLFGAQHRLVGVAMLNEATDLAFLGKSAEAVPLMRRALELYHLDDPNGDDSWPHNRIGLALRFQGDIAGALVEDSAAIATLERLKKPPSGAQIIVWSAYADSLLQSGRATEARVAATRAQEISDKLGEDDFEAAQVRQLQARVSWALGEKELARQQAAAIAPKLEAFARQRGGWYAKLVAQWQLPK